VRRFSALVIAVTACSSNAPPVRVAPVAASAPPAPPAAREAPRNTLGLTVEQLVSPISPASVRFVAPVAGEHIALGAARGYDVHWLSEQLDADALGVDVALDANRPRRLPASQSLVPLGLLVPAGEEPAAGEHWLFAAPIAASGLVPRRAEGEPRSAVAVRFQIGDAAPRSTRSTGTVWLRKPEGTYNGSSSERVLFDAQGFSETGRPVTLPCAIALRGTLAGELRFPSPFAALAFKSGDYEVGASAPGLEPAPTRVITVNAELGRPK
jgi:hypothetical protein